MEENMIKHCIDQLNNEGEFFKLKGWIFSEQGEVNQLRLVATSREKEISIDLPRQKRVDVAHAFQLKNIKCGFGADLIFRRQKNMSVFLEYQIDDEKGRIYLCDVEANSKSGNDALESNKDISFTDFKKEFILDKPKIATKIYDTTVDLIVPVYNGFEYLENLFKGIEKTRVPYRLFIVNDCSPDEKVLPLLETYAEEKENVTLLKNKVNLGFVATVNKALKLSKHHVAIINTDVILPEGWLERLMTPILEDDTIASTTPFTNSGTICSFPNFCENNEIFLGLSVDEIDQYFAKIKPRYVEMPTGVGFCMGMNRKAIKKVGALDAKTFYKGYGEENDWCQRAIKKGFRNVHVENLFVWHKHGGSFDSEDKQRYIERNLQIIGERYPNYHGDVAKYCSQDPNSQIREYVKYRIMKDVPDDFVFILNHNWGGGANTYLDDKVKKMLAEGKGVIQLIDDVERGLICVCQYKKETTEIEATDLDEVFTILEGVKCSDIIVNEMVAFADIQETQEFLHKLKSIWNSSLTMLCHDFFAVCPSIYLIDDKKNHCFFPDIEKCRNCYQNNLDKMNSEYETIDEWRSIWGDFLEKCDEVIAFSENTKSYFEYYYPNIQYTIIPHQVEYIEPVPDYEKSEDIVTIGFIGNLMYTKGAEIIHRMLELIEENFINARIVVIGPDLYGGANRSDLVIHGKYRREELPSLLKQYEVDVVFIASIWPETFSYTTEEAIRMGVPVASFDIGAPADRIKKYEKGIIISEMSADAALREIVNSVLGNEDTRNESEELFSQIEIIDNLAISEGEKEIPKVENLNQGIEYKANRDAALSELGQYVFSWYSFVENKSCLVVDDVTGYVTTSIGGVLKNIKQVSSIDEINNNEKFDYVVLCQVFDSKEVKRATELLQNNGKVLLMADNRIGLRYLSGTTDVHTGRYFSGVNDYVGSSTPDRGYTKKELLDMVEEVDSFSHKFYYLYPNEKTVKEVFTDETIEKYEYGKEYYNFDYGTLEFFSERRMSETLSEVKVISEFANYFVVELSENGDFAPIQYAKINGFRKPEFKILTTIVEVEGEKKVNKFGLTQDAVNHVQKICDNHEGDGVSKIDGGISCEFYSCKSMNDKMVELIADGSIDEIYKTLHVFFDKYFEVAVNTEYSSSKFEKVFGECKDASLTQMQCVKPANIDLICDNIMLLNNGYAFIDEEWVFDFYIPIQFILWRTIRELFANHATLSDIVEYKDFLQHFAIDERMDEIFLAWAEHFVNVYVGTADYEQYAISRKMPDATEWYLNNCNAAEAKLYFDFGQGYSEENKVCAVLQADDNGFFEVRYDIPEGVKNVRWKPVELRCCEAVIDVQGGIIKNHNGKTRDGVTLFQSDSAQYEIEIQENSTRVIISGYIKISDLISSAIMKNNMYGELRNTYYEKLRLAAEINDNRREVLTVLHEKDVEVDRQRTILKNQRNQINKLKQEAEIKKEELKRTQEHVQNITNELRAIQKIYDDILKSKGWKFILLVRKILRR